MKSDYSDWITREDAARIIGVSTKTIEKLERDKKLHRKDRSRPGRPPLAVYNPDDVKRNAEERSRSAEPGILPPETRALAPAPRASLPAGFLEALSNASNSSKVRTAERVFLKVYEASEYSGLPQEYLRQLVREGKLKAITEGVRGWRIRRSDLEKL